MSLFRKLLSGRHKERWIDFFDWIFIEDKFVGWDRDKKEEFTRGIKMIDGFDNRSYICNTLNMPNHANKFTIHMSVNGGQGESLVKHIRNSFAHNRANYRTIKGVGFIEMKDYYNCPTAYILIPEIFLLSMKECYDKVKK